MQFQKITYYIKSVEDRVPWLYFQPSNSDGRYIDIAIFVQYQYRDIEGSILVQSTWKFIRKISVFYGWFVFKCFRKEEAASLRANVPLAFLNHTMASKPRKSPWTQDYIRCEDGWMCLLCKAKVKAPLGNTTNLKSHLKNQHKAKFDEVLSTIAAKEVEKQTVRLI